MVSLVGRLDAHLSSLPVDWTHAGTSTREEMNQKEKGAPHRMVIESRLRLFNVRIRCQHVASWMSGDERAADGRAGRQIESDYQVNWSVHHWIVVQSSSWPVPTNRVAGQRKRTVLELSRVQSVARRWQHLSPPLSDKIETIAAISFVLALWGLGFSVPHSVWCF